MTFLCPSDRADVRSLSNASCSTHRLLFEIHSLRYLEVPVCSVLQGFDEMGTCIAQQRESRLPSLPGVRALQFSEHLSANG